MRHANSRCTLDVYIQARVSAKREAQERVAQMILRDEQMPSEIKLSVAILMNSCEGQHENGL